MIGAAERVHDTIFSALPFSLHQERSYDGGLRFVAFILVGSFGLV